MSTEPVVIRDATGRARHVVLTVAEWQRLREQAELARLDELRAQDRLPLEIAKRILEGERPLKV